MLVGGVFQAHVANRGNLPNSELQHRENAQATCLNRL